MLVIGLTGGIGSGKSTVASIFAGFGAPIVDADVVARDMVLPGSDGLRGITEHFGNGVLHADGTLDRGHLRKLVFDNPVQRRALESILHPWIYAELHRRISALTSPYCIAVIPLLLETGQRHFVDRVLVVDVPEEVQRTRAQVRDGAPVGTIDAVMQAQLDRKTRLAAADDIIDNTVSPSQLTQQILDLHHRYLALADSAPGTKLPLRGPRH